MPEAAPFEAGKAYNKFGAFALLNHEGDFRAAAAALCEAGYGVRDLKSACHAVGAIWTGKAATCNTYEQAKRLAAMFGFDLPAISDRPINFRQQDPTTVVVEAASKKDESFPGWGQAYRKHALSFPVEAPPLITFGDLDGVARHVITSAHEDAGWLLRARDAWSFEARQNVKDLLTAQFSFKALEAAAAMGTLAADPYILVNEPLQPEFLDGRQWNKFGAQLAVTPTYGGQHGHYDMIFRHVGSGLDETVKTDHDCQQLGIRDGYHYIMLWAAIMFQLPKQHLPLLYMYSPDHDSAGKSSLHRSLALLLKRGVVEGVRMLREQFNKDMAGALLCYLDEEKIESKHGQKVKLYVDSDWISIRMMRTDSFRFQNYSKWIASYQMTDALPIEYGDQRIVLWEVMSIPDEEKVPWLTDLKPALESEAADFLGTLLTYPLVQSVGRLYLPVLDTPVKEQVMLENGSSAQFDYAAFEKQIRDGVNCYPFFRGPSRRLIELFKLGNIAHVRRRLRKIAPSLLQHGIIVAFPDDRTIAFSEAPKEEAA
jgi:hypothetical protein